MRLLNLQLFYVFSYITCLTASNTKLYGIYYASATGSKLTSNTVLSCQRTKELEIILQAGNCVRFSSSENLATQLNLTQNIGLKVIATFSLQKYAFEQNQIWHMDLNDLKHDFLKFINIYGNHSSLEMIVVGDIYDPILSEDFQRGVPLAAYRDTLYIFSQMLGSTITHAKSLGFTSIALGISSFMDPFVLSTIIEHVSVDYFIISMSSEHMPYPGFFDTLMNRRIIMQFSRNMKDVVPIKKTVDSFIGIGARNNMWWNNSIFGVIYEEFSDQRWRAISQNSNACSNRYVKGMNYKPCNRSRLGLLQNSHFTNCLTIKPDLLAFAGCYNCVFPDKTLCIYNGGLKCDSSICLSSCMDPLEQGLSVHESTAAITIFAVICLIWAVIHWKDQRKEGEQQARDQYIRVQNSSMESNRFQKKKKSHNSL